jgi:arylsulfatase A
MALSRLAVVRVAACLALASVAATSHAQPASQGRPPNIVLILCDDLGYGDVSFNGRKEWTTPTLDALAKQGTTFRRFYTAAVVCAPSRAALMTGRSTIHNGVTGNQSYDLPSSEVTLAEALKERGYATGLFGKWHAGAARPGSAGQTFPLDQGFDEFFGYTNGGAAWQKFPKRLWDGREQKPVEGYADTLFTTRTIDFINRHKGQPFFAYVPYVTPHGLIEAPAEDIAEHVGKIEDADPSKPWKATYAASMTRIDKEIGRILSTLDELKLADDTIVIFTSDHGATFERLSEFAPIDLDSNAPFRGQKRTLWEGGIRVPGLIRWPGKVPAGIESREPIVMTDLFPTLLAAAGGTAKPEWKLAGTNLLDVIQGKAAAPERTILWEWDESGATYHAAMRGEFKMIVAGGNRPELYNVERDPLERLDIQARHSKLVQQLRGELDAWIATTSDAAKEKKPEKEAGGGGRRRRATSGPVPEAEDL